MRFCSRIFFKKSMQSLLFPIFRKIRKIKICIHFSPSKTKSLILFVFYFPQFRCGKSKKCYTTGKPFNVFFFLKKIFASLSWKKKERKRLFAHNKTRFEIENLINLKLWWKNTLWTIDKILRMMIKKLSAPLEFLSTPPPPKSNLYFSVFRCRSVIWFSVFYVSSSLILAKGSEFKNFNEKKNN